MEYRSYIYYTFTNEVEVENYHCRFSPLAYIPVELIYQNGLEILINDFGSTIVNIPEDIENRDKIFNKILEIVKEVL